MSDTEKIEPISLEDLALTEQALLLENISLHHPTIGPALLAAARAYHTLQAENERLYSEGGREWLLKTLAQDTEITALRDAIAQLREALEPFGRASYMHNGDYGLETPSKLQLIATGRREHVDSATVGDLNRACAVLLSTAHLATKEPQ